MNRSTALIAAAAVLAGLAGFWTSRQLAANEQPIAQAGQHQPIAVDPNDEEAEPLQPLPPFALPDLAGVEKTAADFVGKPMVVNFWATWCAPCRKEMPELMALYRERGSEVQVLGIAMDLVDDVKLFIDEMNIRYPNVIVDDIAGADLIDAFGNPTGMLPFTVFVDADGMIRKSHLGPITLEEVEAELAKLL